MRVPMSPVSSLPGLILCSCLTPNFHLNEKTKAKRQSPPENKSLWNPVITEALLERFWKVPAGHEEPKMWELGEGVERSGRRALGTWEHNQWDALCSGGPAAWGGETRESRRPIPSLRASTRHLPACWEDPEGQAS